MGPIIRAHSPLYAAGISPRLWRFFGQGDSIAPLRLRKRWRYMGYLGVQANDLTFANLLKVCFIALPPARILLLTLCAS